MSEATLDAKAQQQQRSKGVGRFIWYELMTTNLDAARAFYADVLGWTITEWPGAMPYWVVNAGENGVGGMMQLPAEMAETGVPPMWTAYVFVDDVDAALERVSGLGGTVLVPATDIPDVGRFGVILDPQGASINVMHPNGPDQPDRTMELGHVSWHELHTTDSAKAFEFYAALFGWVHASSMDMGELGTYSIFRHPAAKEEQWLGGMSDMAKHYGRPPAWFYYVNVADLDAAMERTRAAGGQVLNGPMDVPGGRAAQCSDPQGAMFSMFAESRD